MSYMSVTFQQCFSAVYIGQRGYSLHKTLLGNKSNKNGYVQKLAGGYFILLGHSAAVLKKILYSAELKMEDAKMNFIPSGLNTIL